VCRVGGSGREGGLPARAWDDRKWDMAIETLDTMTSMMTSSKCDMDAKGRRVRQRGLSPGFG